MTEREEKIMTSIVAAIPKMTEFQRGYFLGQAEAMAETKTLQRNNTETDQKAG